MKQKWKSCMDYFSNKEKALWCISAALVITSFAVFDGKNYLTLTASLIGITSLIYNAKGNPFGQLLIIIFSLLYGVISYGFAYYGEMTTYLGMTAPMSVLALVSWLKNPHKGNRAEVEIGRLKSSDIIWMSVFALAVTFIFYFVLKAFGTTNLLPSTVSVTTSFTAVYLTYKRSAFFALAYAANDAVLIVLWGLAALTDISYISVVTCFIMFLVNDTYTFINWRRIYRRQQAQT